MKLGMRQASALATLCPMGTQVPLSQRGTAPQFLVHICCGQMARWIKMPLGRKVGLDPSDIVLDEDPAALPQKGGRAPQFSAHVYCAQTAAGITMPLGMEVGLDPSDIVLDGDPAPLPKKGAEPSPIFGPCLLWPNGWMDQDATWCEGRPRPRPHCVTWGPSSPPPGKKRHSPQFLAHVYCGQTVAHLSYC